jgi:hypothetical protein
MGETVLTTATVTNNLTVSSITSLTGNLSVMGELMSLDSVGNLVTITGNLKVTGLADLAQLTSREAEIASLSAQTLTVDTIYNQQLELLASQSADMAAQIASISSVLGLATSSAVPLSPTIFSSSLGTNDSASVSSWPVSTIRSPDLPMTLEEFLATQALP